MACTHPLQPLYQTENGVVFQCQCYSWFNILFGPLLLGHTVQGLYDLKTFVDTLDPEINPAVHMGARCYHMRLPRVPVGLVFTSEEMEELSDLLHGATVMHASSTTIRVQAAWPDPHILCGTIRSAKGASLVSTLAETPFTS